MIQVNDKAPTFALKNQNNETIRLEDYLGKKVVLYFYPKDSSPGCTTQACAFRDYNKDIEALGAVVLGVSPDDVESHEKFANKKELNFDILSDPSTETIKAYDLWKEQSMFGHTFTGTVRSTFIIDENGNVEKVYEKANAKNNAQNVYEYLKANK